MQSPIDLSNKRVKVVKHLGQLKNKYKPSIAIIKNRGHDISVTFSSIQVMIFRFCFLVLQHKEFELISTKEFHVNY